MPRQIPPQKSVLAWAALALAAAGLVVFGSGFLVRRTALGGINTCGQLGDPSAPACRASSLWEPSFDRLVLVVIDALRHDFLIPSSSSNLALKVPARLQQDHPEHALSFVFRADPPTTTLQRLKALTTGTLPTFVESGSNFGSAHVQEDSWIAAARRANLSLVCLGDDVWAGLYPTQFGADAHLFPGLNVWDLDTLDASVLDVLWPYARTPRKRWSVLIAHFLGVDHAGHRYGPVHPAMARKLSQLDGVLEKLVDEFVDNRTLLAILGDHGMDAKGDHGGDTEPEVNAGLFLYSSGAPLTRSRDPLLLSVLDQTRDIEQLRLGLQPEPPQAAARMVAQVDLVPTLALLLGLPIPRESLGSFVPEVAFGPAVRSADAARRLVQAALVNGDQLRHFIDQDSARTGGLPRDAHAELAAAHERFVAAAAPMVAPEIDLDPDDALSAYELYLLFSRQTLRKCRQLWAQFNVSRMTAGLLMVALALIVTGVWTGRPTLTFFSLASAGAMALHAASLLSDSFTVHEESIVHTLLQSLVVVAALGSSRDAWAPAAVLLALNRVVRSVTVCRYEQMPFCSPTLYASATSSVTWPPAMLAYALTLAVAAAMAPRAAPRWRLAVAYSAVWLYWAIDLAANTMEDGPIPDGVHLDAVKLWFARSALPAAALVAAAGPSWPSKTLTLAHLAVLVALKPAAGAVFALQPLALRSLDALVRRAGLPPPWTAAVVYLLALQAFFGTGHEATLQSIDWSVGFIGVHTANYVVSPLLIALNFFGPPLWWLFSAPAVLGPLRVRPLVLLLLLSTVVASFSALHLRQHHKIWKVFAPRWLLAVSVGIFGSVSTLLGSTMVGRRVVRRPSS